MHHHIRVVRHGVEDFLDAKRVVLGREDILDLAGLDGLLLLAHDRLDKVDVYRLKWREVQAAVDCQQAEWIE